MKIKVLGNGGAYSKLPTSFLINDSILIDCGQEIVKSLIHNFESPVLDKVKHIFITHIHADHINGLETLLYYKFIKNHFKPIELTIYGSEEVFNYYKSLACSKDPIKNGKYYQPFKFEVLPMNGGSSLNLSNENIYVNYIKANHMNGTLQSLSYVFIDNQDMNKKIIITGDIDKPHHLITSSMINDKTLIFHDMGWTNLPEVPKEYKFHPREEEVYEIFGNNKNVIGVHTDAELKYYKKAEVGETFVI